jgi:hypothetical protein
MADENLCPTCGAVSAPAAPPGLCPRCLMKAALAEADETSFAEPGATGSGQSLEATGPDPEMTRAQGDMAGAGKAHDKALAVRQKLADANHGVPEFQADVARSLTDLGSLRLKSGKPGEALDYFSREDFRLLLLDLDFLKEPFAQ